MARRPAREDKLRLIEEALAPSPAGAQACATCRGLPASATHHEKCRGVEVERQGGMPPGKAALVERLAFDDGAVLRCPSCGGLYLYLRDYDSEPGFGWELSESLERLDAAALRDRLAQILEARPETKFFPGTPG